MSRIKTTSSIRLTIDSNLNNVFLVGLTVEAICSYAPFKAVTAYQVGTSVVEAVNNAIKHAYGNQPGHQVEVDILLNPEGVRFEISDTGRPMRLQGSHKLEYDPEDLENLPEGGMGLFIINQVMDHVEYKSFGDRNLLTMGKYYDCDPQVDLCEGD